MGRHGLWIPAVEKGRARAVQNMVAAAEATASPEPIAVAAVEATASLEPIAVDVMVDMVRLESVVVARSVDPEVPLMGLNVVARSADPEAHLVEQVVVVGSVEPVVPLAGDAAVEVVRILSIIFSRRLRPPFFYDLG